jgi:lipooligosaccharide transport system ATP-binding protein
MEKILIADHLVKRYPSGHLALDDFSFYLQKGECLGIIGPNGAGKTTAIKICLGLSAPDCGSVGAFGYSLPQDGREVRAKMGVVAQFDSLDPDFTCTENLRIYARYFGIPRRVIDARIPELLDFAQLSHKAEAKIAELSGGMKRRLSLARALVNDPDLLVLDEPTTGLDPQARRMIWERLGELTKSGKSILLTTHFMEEAERLCDRVIVMDRGQKIAEGTPAELIAAHGVGEGRGTLEDVFFALTGKHLRDDE